MVPFLPLEGSILTVNREVPSGSATNSIMLKAALSYARRGVPVFPLHSIDGHGVCTCGGPEVNPKCTPGKHPRTTHSPRPKSQGVC
jgi:hypothetical protein